MKKVILSAVLLILAFVVGYMVGKAQNARVERVRNIVPRLKVTPVARVVGENGYLVGWDVVDENSERLCSDPYVWVSIKEIECEVEQ